MSQFYTCNNLTPMGAVPISVIYGFEYPLNGSNPHIKTSGKDLQRLDQYNNIFCKKQQEKVQLRTHVRKTNGCLTELKKLRKANFVSTRTKTVPVTRFSCGEKFFYIIFHKVWQQVWQAQEYP